jgi:PLP dependent protein
MIEPEQIAQRLAEVRARIVDAVRRVHRGADSVGLVLASKTQPPEAVAAAYHAGARMFGENYVQEAVAKRAALKALTEIRWHLIGHLQRNKAAPAIATFALVQTLDRQPLAAAFFRLRTDPRVAVLVEVNLGGELSKTGVAPEHAEALIEAARDQVEIRGLMTIPPPSPNPEDARRYFARLRELRDQLATASGLALSELSMGMTNDFEVAIEEGATIVRVGRAVFGERRT